MVLDHYLKTTCRLCNSMSLDKALPLTPTALCDAYAKEKSDEPVYPLDLFQCDDCGFIQLGCVVNSDLIYKNYIYITTSSSDLISHFSNYADHVVAIFDLKSDSFIIDIGSNDGTLLKSFQEKGFDVLGIEPAKKIADYANQNGVETLPEFFDLALAKNIEKTFGFANLITLNNVFANIDELNSVVSGIKHLLSDEGIFIIETSYLLDFAKNMVFDSIYHEHLSYFTILPLVKFFSKYQLKLIRVERIPTKGGSLRFYWANELSEQKVDSSVAVMIQNELNENINAAFFRQWMRKIEDSKNNLIQLLNKYKGKRVIGYGASATSTTLIYHFGLHRYLDCLIDDNPVKLNTYSPGHHIPVRKLEDSELDNECVVIILAWRFYKEILEKLNLFSCCVIVPLPCVRILKKE